MNLSVNVTFWSRPGRSRHDTALGHPCEGPAAEMPFSPEERFRAGRMNVPADGTLTLDIFSPRPLRI